MTEHFRILSSSEYDQLKDMISYITFYIAGADGNIDEGEMEWAEKIAKIRSYNLPEDLRSFYSDVGVDFQEKLDYLKNSLSKDQEERMSYLAGKLAEINPILAKLDSKLGSELYKSFRSFAKHVASATGGFLGFFTIGPKEAELIKLSMINEISHEE